MAKQSQSQKGQGLIEYALIIVLICVVAIVIYGTLNTGAKKPNSGGFLSPATTYAAELNESNPAFTTSMIMDWCRYQGGECSDITVTQNTVEVRADEGQMLSLNLKFWQLNITEPGTYRLTYKATSSNGYVDEQSIDPALYEDGYLIGIVKLELTLKRI